MIPSLSHLKLAYLNAWYVAPEKNWLIRPGARHRELDSWLEKTGCQTWTFITAFNPGSNLLPAAENRRWDQLLAQALADLPRVRAFGKDPENTFPDEAGWLAAGLGREPSLILAARFGQAAILFGEKGQPAELLFTLPYLGTKA